MLAYALLMLCFAYACDAYALMLTALLASTALLAATVLLALALLAAT